MKYRHICEVCGKEKILTPEEAYDEGWDYPPMFGEFGIISPRTCPDCMMVNTVWWKLVQEKIDPKDLSEKDKETLVRIVSEPESILVQ